MGQPLPPEHFTALENFTEPKHFGHHLSVRLEAHPLSVLGLSEMTGPGLDLMAQRLGGQQILAAHVAFSLGEVFGGSPLTLLEVQRAGVLGACEPGEA